MYPHGLGHSFKESDVRGQIVPKECSQSGRGWAYSALPIGGRKGTKVTGVTPEACAASNLGRIGYRLLLQTGPGSQVAVCQSLTLRSIMPAKGQLPPAARLYQQDAHLVEQGPEMVEAAGVEPASLANEPAATTCLVREMFSSGR